MSSSSPLHQYQTIFQLIDKNRTEWTLRSVSFSGKMFHSTHSLFTIHKWDNWRNPHQKCLEMWLYTGWYIVIRFSNIDICTSLFVLFKCSGGMSCTMYWAVKEDSVMNLKLKCFKCKCFQSHFGEESSNFFSCFYQIWLVLLYMQFLCPTDH